MEKITHVDNFLEPNIKVTVDVLSGEFQDRYDSRIEIVNKDFLYITVPTKNAIPAPLTPGTKIEVSFITDKGRFSFNSEVVERIKENILMLKITKPSFLTRKELRRYFRVETYLKIIICKINYNANDNIPEMLKECDYGIIKDISGGGVKLVTELPLKVENIVELDFNNTINNIKEIFGKVVRVINLNNKYEAGIEFISIRENDRDKIIQYVFKRQIELKKMQK
ncbi:flagellar brake protein [Deferribacter abyssi]|uniref:flagellar brake protein n=1 Tax=Deferribacter abyssi TaxID=213806 RepID=UPI003C27E9AE